MGLSSSSLFHYTDSLETVQKIIEGGFSPSYCSEDLIAVPMISFCDIPLTQAAQYMDYGDYAIGMNRSWVYKNGLNPVNYVQVNSAHDKMVTEGLTSANKINKFISQQENEIYNNKEFNENMTNTLWAFLDVYRYQKPYEGKLVRNGELVDKKHRFYNEREWRYVPDFGDKTIKPFMQLDQYDEYKKVQSKPHLSQIKLNLTADDIDYIILKDKNDVYPFIQFLEGIENLGSTVKIKLLTTRIVTKEQIVNDF